MRETRRLEPWVSSILLLALVVLVMVALDLRSRRPAVTFEGGGVVDALAFVGQGPMVMQRMIDPPGEAEHEVPEADDPTQPFWIRLHDFWGEGSFEVVHGRHRLLAVRGDRMRVQDRVPMIGQDVEYFAPDPGKGGDPMIEPDTDLDGDGVPEFIVSEYTGGANCCFRLHICKVWPDFHHQVLDLDYASGGIFLQLDSDPAMEAEVRDFSMDFFYSGPRRGVAPPLKMDFDGREWRPSASLMRAAPATEAEIEAMVQAWDGFEIDDAGMVRKFGSASPHPWAPMVRLIYTGHADQAWDVLARAMPKSLRARQAFWTGMLEYLRQSEGWDTLVEMNGAALTR